MNRVTAILIAMCPLTLSAHPCPFDWNIEFATDTEIKGTSLGDFIAKFNEAAKKETKGGITKAIIYNAKPDTFRKIPENSPFSTEMDALLQRYVEVTAPLVKKGLHDSGTAPIAVSFPAKIPVACLLAAEFYGEATNYEETKEGARVTRRREVLECRSYHVSERFLETVSEWRREDRIPVGAEAAPYIFASFSGMTWTFHTFPDPEKDSVEESILGGVTRYLPENKVVLAIETKEKHEEMAKVMFERRFLEAAEPASPDKNGQAPDKP